MTDHTPLTELLAEVRRLDGEATEGPWEFEPDRTTRDGVYPAYVFAEHMAGYPICDATSTHIPAGDEDAEFIALSRTALPALAAAVEAVMEMHRPISVYAHEDECENPDEEHRENRHHEYADEAGEFYCEDLFQYAVCVGCKDSPYVNWFDDWPEYPCPTIRALNEAMGGRDDE